MSIYTVYTVGVYILFPSAEARYIDEVVLDETERAKIKKIVVIENKWSGNRRILEHASICRLPRLQIRSRDTLYWRFQEKSREHLATIEAIYYAVKDVIPAKEDAADESCSNVGHLDDLMLLFAYNHERVRQKVAMGKAMPKIWTGS